MLIFQVYFRSSIPFSDFYAIIFRKIRIFHLTGGFEYEM